MSGFVSNASSNCLFFPYLVSFSNDHTNFTSVQNLRWVVCGRCAHYFSGILDSRLKKDAP